MSGLTDHVTLPLETLLPYSFSVDSEAGLDPLTHLAAHICQTPIAFVLVIAAGQLSLCSSLGWPPDVLTLSSLPFTSYALQQKEGFVVHDASIDPRFLGHPLIVGKPCLRFYAGIPLTSATGELLGLIGVMDHIPRTLDSHQRDGLALLALQVAGQIQQQQEVRRLSATLLKTKRQAKVLQQSRQKLYHCILELEQNNRQLKLLTQLNHKLQTCLTLQSAYQAIATLLQPLFPQTSGALFITSSDQQSLETVASWGTLEGQKILDLQAEQAMCHSHPPFETHISTALPCQYVHPDSLVKSFCVPVRSQGQVFGLLYLSSTQSDQLPPSQHRLAVVVAQQMAIALGNLELLETLQNHSVRDPLTGLFNRRYLTDALEQIIQRAHHGQYSVGLIMLDIDHFKHFNDTYGHQAGDMVLKDFSVFLKGYVRGTDIACRYGGEEFIFILPSISLQAAQQRAEKICRGIKYLKMKHHGRSLPNVTVSAGVALFPEHGTTGDILIEAADAALYQAKTEGRDRVVVASPFPNCPIRHSHVESSA